MRAMTTSAQWIWLATKCIPNFVPTVKLYNFARPSRKRMKEWHFSICERFIYFKSLCSSGALWHHGSCPPLVEYLLMGLLPDTQNCGWQNCVAHVPWCMPGSLTSGFLWNQWREKRSRHSRRMRNPQFYVSGKRPIVCLTSSSLKQNQY